MEYCSTAVKRLLAAIMSFADSGYPSWYLTRSMTMACSGLCMFGAKSRPTVSQNFGECRRTYMCPRTDCEGEKMSYPDVQSRADMMISSPMKIHGKNGSKGTTVAKKKPVRNACETSGRHKFLQTTPPIGCNARDTYLPSETPNVPQSIPLLQTVQIWVFHCIHYRKPGKHTTHNVRYCRNLLHQTNTNSKQQQQQITTHTRFFQSYNLTLDLVRRKGGTTDSGGGFPHQIF